MNGHATGTSRTGPALEPLVIDPPAPARVAPARGPGPIARARRWAAPHRRSIAIAAGVLAVAGGVGAWLALRPAPRPDFAAAPMDELFSYTLLTDEFNRLPVERRLELIGQLVERLKGMSGSDSALLAAFAASIQDEMRRQLMENASRLAVDVWDLHAKDYARVPDEERGAYLDAALLDYMKMMEAVAGERSEKSDAERLEEARRMMASDDAMLREGRGPTRDQMGRIAAFMWFDVAQHTTPQQRGRGQLMMRDMVRRLRDQKGGG